MKTKMLITISLLGIITLSTIAQTNSIDYLGQTPPGDTPVVFARGIVSDSLQQHGVPSFSPDGNEVFWKYHRIRAVPIRIAGWQVFVFHALDT